MESNKESTLSQHTDINGPVGALNSSLVDPLGGDVRYNGGEPKPPTMQVRNLRKSFGDLIVFRSFTAALIAHGKAMSTTAAPATKKKIQYAQGPASKSGGLGNMLGGTSYLLVLGFHRRRYLIKTILNF